MHEFVMMFFRPRGRVGIYTRIAFFLFNVMMFFIFKNHAEGIADFANSHKRKTAANISFIQGSEQALLTILQVWFFVAVFLLVLVYLTRRKLPPQKPPGPSQSTDQETVL